jgi:NAD(P)-dependent dehydrogenase (short-subunit alcohol dehydrogenase family)
MPAAYSVSKEAIIVWTLMVSADLITRGIRVKCTSPGAVQTPMLEENEKTTPAPLDRPHGAADRPPFRCQGTGDGADASKESDLGGAAWQQAPVLQFGDAAAHTGFTVATGAEAGLTQLDSAQ